MGFSPSGFGLALALGAAMALGAGCFEGTSGESTADTGPNAGGGAETPDEDRDDGFGGANSQCTVASDCVLAASTCCECPSFAAPMGEGYDAGCDEVDCQEPTGLCPAVEATCSAGECLMICSPIITDKTCSVGFIRDDAGCLTNECALPLGDAAQCEADTDCVQIPADCCGCSQGGEDQAAPATDADALIEALACPSNPACPDIDVCDETQVPRCVTGSCVLTDEETGPGLDPAATQLCGTPQLNACPAPSVCVLNDVSAKEASDLGVGSCSPE